MPMERRRASLLLAAATAASAAPYEYTEAGLRGVESFLEYPQVQYPIRSMSVPVRTLSDSSWEGFIDFGRTGGAPSDPWVTDTQCFTDIVNMNLPECNPGISKMKPPGGEPVDVVTTAPCNTVSNAAYYWTLDSLRSASSSPDSPFTEDEQASIESMMVVMLVGSFGLHGTTTETFGTLDSDGIGYFAWSIFQAALVSVPGAKDNPLLWTLNHTEYTDAIPLAASLANVIVSQDPADANGNLLWSPRFNELTHKMPEYETTFGALTMMLLVLIFRDNLFISPINGLFTGLAAALGLADQERDYLLDVFQPALREAMKGKEYFKWGMQKETAKTFMAMMFKMMYAFLWQRDMFTQDVVEELTRCAEANDLGGDYMPKVNAMANKFGGTTTTYKNENVQLCEGVYTADYDCRRAGLPEAVMEKSPLLLTDYNRVAPHAKWHEQSANALFDLYMLAYKAKVALMESKDCKEKKVDPYTGLCTTNTGTTKNIKVLAEGTSFARSHPKMTALALDLKSGALDAKALLEEFFSKVSNTPCFDKQGGDPHITTRALEQDKPSASDKFRKITRTIVEMIAANGDFVCEELCPPGDSPFEGPPLAPPSKDRRKLLFAPAPDLVGTDAPGTCCWSDVLPV